MVSPRQAVLVSIVNLCLISSVTAPSQANQNTALSPSGPWQAFLANPESTVELNLLLEVQATGVVSGSYTLQNGVAGTLSGQFSDKTLLLVFVDPASDCPMAFTLRVNLTGGAGAGTYIALSCNGATENGVVSMSKTSSSNTSSSLAKCRHQHIEDGYWSWLCDEQGTALADQTEIFVSRTNRFGQEGVMSVWRGSKTEWELQASEIILQHQVDVSLCEVYYHVAYLNPAGIQWNRFFKDMSDWHKKDARKTFPALCYTSEPSGADYVIAYSDSEYSVSYSYSWPVTTTTYHTGTTTGSVGGEYVSGSYSGTSTTTRNEIRSVSWPTWDVTAGVYPVKANSTLLLNTETLLFNTKHTGRWRWSKPDKDSLIDALKFIQGRTRVPARPE